MRIGGVPQSHGFENATCKAKSTLKLDQTEQERFRQESLFCLKHINDFWEVVASGNPDLIDADTVKLLECLAPGHSGRQASASTPLRKSLPPEGLANHSLR
jgi:hypothetical protein